jgi:hypothetical protein
VLDVSNPATPVQLGVTDLPGADVNVVVPLGGNLVMVGNRVVDTAPCQPAGS